MLEEVPENSTLIIDLTRVEFIDKDIPDTIDEYTQHAHLKNIRVDIKQTTYNDSQLAKQPASSVTTIMLGNQNNDMHIRKLLLENKAWAKWDPPWPGILLQALPFTNTRIPLDRFVPTTAYRPMRSRAHNPGDLPLHRNIANMVAYGRKPAQRAGICRLRNWRWNISSFAVIMDAAVWGCHGKTLTGHHQ